MAARVAGGVVACALALAPALGCAKGVMRAEQVPVGEVEATRHRFTGSAMGAAVEIVIEETDDAAGRERARAAARAALVELERLDFTLSDWKSTSELSQFNRSTAARVSASEDLRAVLTRALEVAERTDGLYDPTIGPLVKLWRASRATGALPDAATLESARARVGWRGLSIDGPDIVRADTTAELDFGGIGKGYGAVRAVEAARRAGAPRVLVAVAGDIAAGDAPRDGPAWSVEIAAESPALGAERVVLENGAVSTSGASVQWVEIDGVRYAHIVDPRTGLGAQSPAQVTVVGPLDSSVDALGTALALTRDDAEAAVILARFPHHSARIERSGVVSWIGATARDGAEESARH
jgi:thiamine biosynthesis lipoprotein